ncbi:serine/threonine-protein kinase pim-2-like [Polypterus senegalus]|uniref:serine/threonine-protein kinase pim-2-like n=1 Tax=Polypterus senegalus TaxID=55291 RepID=UPI00196694A6|nr:serine/threonine-protein kinase pim-2-like [Polypterus senegalus]
MPGGLRPGEKGKVPLEVGLLKRVCAVPAGPNIIQMSEYILGRRYMFIFMELLESYTSLEDVIYKKTGPLSEEKAKHAFRQIVQAVLHCHSRGVFHNDIKPNNIMYQTTTGQIKLIDFGYGDLLKEKYYPHAPGTPAYWPPEWYLFRKYKAEPVTVWTLGITLFELLCGNRPFKEKMEILECKISYTNEISGGMILLLEELRKSICSDVKKSITALKRDIADIAECTSYLETRMSDIVKVHNEIVTASNEVEETISKLSDLESPGPVSSYPIFANGVQTETSFLAPGQPWVNKQVPEEPMSIGLFETDMDCPDGVLSDTWEKALQLIKGLMTSLLDIIVYYNQKKNVKGVL